MKYFVKIKDAKNLLKMKKEASPEAEAIKISLRSYKEIVVEAYSVLFGSRPVVLYSSVAAFDLILLFAYFYEMGFFALAALLVLVSYIICAVYLRFQGVLQKLLFPQKKDAEEEKPSDDKFDEVCEKLADLQKIFFKIVEILFDGELGSGPLKIAITAGIWLAITLTLNYFGKFWIGFLLINAALLAPSIIKSTMQNQPAAPVSAPAPEHEDGSEHPEEEKVKTE